MIVTALLLALSVSAFKDFRQSLPVSDNAPVQAAPAAALKYGGGPVLANVEIFPVYYGSDTLFQSQTTAFYASVANSPLMDMMSQYSTPSQKIGRGKLVGSYVIASPSKKSISETDIQAALQNLVSQGIIKPNANTVQTSAGQVAYGVIPDQSGQCLGCGGAGGQGDAFRAVTDSASHELAEAVTDPQPTTGWNGSGGEIGDLCNPTSGFVTGGDGQVWFIQGEWSNSLNACWLGDGSTPGKPTTTAVIPVKQLLLQLQLQPLPEWSCRLLLLKPILKQLLLRCLLQPPQRLLVARPTSQASRVLHTVSGSATTRLFAATLLAAPWFGSKLALYPSVESLHFE
ncbi:hypothetical protein BCR33DRAFT_769184 [Rhizoclosmatium globosum]|uniref:Uncharacterized protein n=1 Tax=Rhizoclosmatium globosum TaxID=329046 RepID=A0A1Y2BUC4_9FUNG|nr:hypothetical protein BCR33DRAFT_769184 [Rhizoclosmatium globosum]|eukprot:ORY38368.1 hypothetical protein BCR33DRAFT_769184 [Rhizoclosmatium globosum]